MVQYGGRENAMKGDALVAVAILAVGLVLALYKSLLWDCLLSLFHAKKQVQEVVAPSPLEVDIDDDPEYERAGA